MGDVTTLHFGAIRLSDFVDLVFDQEHVFVFDVGHYSMVVLPDGKWEIRTLKAAGEHLKIDSSSGEDDAVLWSSAGLNVFATEVNHYQLSALGLKSVVDDLAGLYVRAGECNWATGRPVLAEVPEADAYVDIHDDCYAYIEVRKPEVADRAIERLLWSALFTVANRAGVEPPSGPPGLDVIEACVGDGGEFFAGMGGGYVSGGKTVVPFSHTDTKVFQAVPPATHELHHSTTNGWSVNPLG